MHSSLLAESKRFRNACDLIRENWKNISRKVSLDMINGFTILQNEGRANAARVVKIKVIGKNIMTCSPCPCRLPDSHAPIGHHCTW